MILNTIKKKFIYSAILLAVPTFGGTVLSTDVKATNDFLTYNSDVLKQAAEVGTEKAVQVIDITTGWEILDWASDYAGQDPNKILQQGHESADLNQRMMVMQFGNIGEATMTIQKKISMKKGNTYSFNLAYAMFFNSTGSGYIDFNGNIRTSNSSPGDQLFEESVTPAEDMDYVITAGFSVPRLGNGFMKIAHSMDEDGVTVTANVPELQINNPEGNHNEVVGTGISGNKAEIYDASQKLLGETFIDENGDFKVITNRILVTGETLTGYQVDADNQRSFGTKVTVAESALSVYPVEVNLGLVEGTVNQAATIEVFDEDGISLGVETLENAGEFSIETNRKLIFLENLTIKATMLDGTNRSLAVTVQDTIAPKAPLLNPIDNQQLLITGESDESNLAIYVQQGEALYRTFTQSDGEFELYIDQPFESGSVVACWAEDQAGNKSEVTSVVVVPVASIIELDDDVTSLSTEITGRTNMPNTDVTVIVGSRIYNVTSGKNGEFSVKLATTYPVGTNVTASVYDNLSGTDITASIKVRPKTPTVSFLSTSSKVVNGSTDANSEIILTVVRDGETFILDSVNSDDSGNFELPLMLDGAEFKLNFGDIVRIQAKHISTGVYSLVHEEFIFVK